MSYSNFNIKQVQSTFQLDIMEEMGIFSKIKESPTSDYFTATLKENLPLAVSINTEKARSELIISNVLIEIRKIFDRKISFFQASNLL